MFVILSDNGGGGGIVFVNHHHGASTRRLFGTFRIELSILKESIPVKIIYHYNTDISWSLEMISNSHYCIIPLNRAGAFHNSSKLLEVVHVVCMCAIIIMHYAHVHSPFVFESWHGKTCYSDRPVPCKPGLALARSLRIPAVQASGVARPADRCM